MGRGVNVREGSDCGFANTVRGRPATHLSGTSQGHHQRRRGGGKECLSPQFVPTFPLCCQHPEVRSLHAQTSSACPQRASGPNTHGCCLLFTQPLPQQSGHPPLGRAPGSHASWSSTDTQRLILKKQFFLSTKLLKRMSPGQFSLSLVSQLTGPCSFPWPSSHLGACYKC